MVSAAAVIPDDWYAPVKTTEIAGDDDPSDICPVF